MSNQNVVPVNQVTTELNSSRFGVKRAMRTSFNEIRELIGDFADPDKPLVVDGKVFKGADKYGPAATLALQNKMEQLQNKSTTILSIFDMLLNLERKLGQ